MLNVSDYLTEEERAMQEHGAAWMSEAMLERVFRSLAASRALVAEQRNYIQTRAKIHQTGEAAMTEEWRPANCQGCQAEAVLALNEAEMLKRLEE